ncbi:hypothetical protein IX51_08810 [uncultured archaeon]|nr:hypothetical protein IX51_08810 [uncultured archaeon]
MKFNRYGNRRIDLAIVGGFAILGIILAAVIPKVLYPGETQTMYTSKVQLLLPIIAPVFFVIGMTISLWIRKGSRPSVYRKNNGINYPVPEGVDEQHLFESIEGSIERNRSKELYNKGKVDLLQRGIFLATVFAKNDEKLDY